MRRAALVLAWLAATALLLELGARGVLWALGPGDAPIAVGWERDAASERARDLLYVPDRELFFRLAPNLELAETGNPRIFDVRTNGLGLRGRELAGAAPGGPLRVLAVGDSCTFGSGAGDGGTYPAQLEGALTARAGRPVEVINAGVPGFSSFQALRYLEVEGFALGPAAVIFASAINDANPATAGAKRRFGSGRMLSDREFAAALRAQRSGLERLLWRAGFALGVAGAAAPVDGGVKRRVSLEEYQENLTRFARLAREQGALPVIAAWPLRSQAAGGAAPDEVETLVARYQGRAGQVAAATGALFVDLRPALAGRPERFVDEVHLDPSGYRLVARELARELAPRLLPGSAGGPPGTEKNE